jgi:hypothetical protein
MNFIGRRRRRRRRREGSVLYLFKYFLKFYFNYLAGVISL